MSRFVILLSAVLVALALLTQQVTATSTASSKTILEITNKLRAKHHAPALKWDNKLATYAQKWSNKCNFEHSDGPYGENLALGYPTWSSVINDGWYSEVKDYNYSKPGFSMDTGHFTQLVWKSTSKIGCGVKTCPDGKLYTCSFSGYGNIVSDGNTFFIENVLKP